MQKKLRDPTFDIMKGIAMIMVIMSHTLPFEMMRPFAPFRSALFFIISGYFAKEWPFLEFMQKGAKRLIIPYVATCIFMAPLVILGERIYDVDILPTALKSMLFGASAFGYDGKWSEINIGPLWFVCASIWVRILWSFFRKVPNVYVQGGGILLLAMLACRLKALYINPWSIFSAFGALGFFYAGYIIRSYSLLNVEKGKRFVPTALLILIYCMSFSKMDINYCIYERGYVIELIASVGAFVLVYAVVQHFSNVSGRLWKYLNFLGRYSLVAFCIHAVDQCLNVHWLPFKLWSFFTLEYEQICAVIIRVILVTVGCFLVSKNNFLKEKIFFIKD